MKKENIIERIKKKFYEDYFLYIADIQDYQAKSGKNYHVEELTEELLDRIMREHKDEVPEYKYNLLKKRLSKDSTERYMIIFDENYEIGSFICIAYDEHKEDLTGFNIPNDEDSIYIFDLYTFKAQRGKGFGAFVIGEILKKHYDTKYKKVYGIVLENNYASEENIKKYNFKRIKRIRKYKIFFKDKIKVVNV